MSEIRGIDRREALLSAAAVAIAAPQVATSAAPRDAAPGQGRRQSFDLDWRFHRGGGAGFEAPGLDDSAWRAVDLPHDWSIEDLPRDPTDPDRIRGPFDAKAQGGAPIGYTIGGEGWYRKRFRLAISRPGHVELLFDGVYMDSDVWLNGHRVGGRRNGYIPFACDLTPYLAADGDNVIAVRVRNPLGSARWYSGSGIYRHVWLDVLPEAARLDRWGTRIATHDVTDGTARIGLECAAQGPIEGLTITAAIRDPGGREVWRGSVPADARVHQSLALSGAPLWSPERPALHIAVVELRREATVLDRIEVPFGIRVVAFDPAGGLTVNGAPTKLRGGCIHHDHGILGAASFDVAEQRKVALLKARGFNAVRPSHNLFSPAFLAACDAQGMMVMCDTFDLWLRPKTAGDYATFFAEDWEADLDALVRSARNHPSIVLWSIGNEIPGRNEPAGVEMQWRLANRVHALDPTRPVTAAINGFAGHVVTPSTDAARAGAQGVPDRTSTVFLDVVGYNYKLADYDADHGRFPTRVLFGSESFPKDVFAIWRKVERAPWLVGDFVWTAMDYLGEAGIGGSELVRAGEQHAAAEGAKWPWVNAYCGDIDLIGNQKPGSLARDVAWGVSALEVAVQRPVPAGMTETRRLWGWADELPSWSWPEAQGPLAVRVYTAGDSVEVRLNGQAIETRRVSPSHGMPLEFLVRYEPGVLEVIARRNGSEIGRRRLETVGPPVAIRLRREPFGGGAARGDLSYVAVEIIDAEGRTLPDLERDIVVSVEGAAKLQGFGSANPLAVGSYRSGSARSWRGRALAVLRGSGRAGRTVVSARSEGLMPARLFLRLG